MERKTTLSDEAAFQAHSSSHETTEVEKKRSASAHKMLIRNMLISRLFLSIDDIFIKRGPAPKPRPVHDFSNTHPLAGV
jgi:hypothetical protein